jgi:hypothetical protein
MCLQEIYQGRAQVSEPTKPIPIRVRMRETVRPDFPFLLDPKNRGMVAMRGEEFPCAVNPHGAVSVVFPSGEKLGVKPDEFDVIAWE